MTADQVATRIARLAYEKVYQRVREGLRIAESKGKLPIGHIIEINHKLEVGGNVITTETGYESAPKEKT
jgi:hypothetical protein